MVVHRGHVKEELIQIFSDKEIMQQPLEWRFIDDQGRQEEGVGSGVQRDVFATFWQSVFSSLTVGDVQKVPCIRHDHQKNEWEAVCRVLVYGFKHANYLPVSISPVFLASCLYGEETITEEDLLSSFTYYITADEREALNKCLQPDYTDFQDEDLLDLLSTYKCYRLPTRENIRLLLTELAHQEIIQKPRYIAHCWAPIISMLKKHPHFSCLKSISDAIVDMTPSTKKVIKALKVAEIKTDAERQSFDYLKKFIKTLDGASLKIFLKFVTGSDVLVTHQDITIYFTSIDGMARRIIVHTCEPSLELPSTYQSYTEMMEEFNNILRSKEAWNFNIV